MRRAWDEYDIVVHLSGHYKQWSKALYVIQLLFAWLLVVATTVRNTVCYDPSMISVSEMEECKRQFETGIFFTAATASFVLFLDNLFFSTKRWRQLRSGASSLESIIWSVQTVYRWGG